MGASDTTGKINNTTSEARNNLDRAFSLIICTAQRPLSLQKLLKSIEKQSILPPQILIIDGSENEATEKILFNFSLEGLEYYKVDKKNKGLTRQRNFGVGKLKKETKIVFFLDDDTILSTFYFEEVLKTYRSYPDAVGVGGYITNEVEWKKVSEEYVVKKGEFQYDSWVRREGSRFVLRRKCGLAPDVPPGMMPDFSHGYSIGFLPPSGKVYEIEMMMGGIASYKKELFDKISFSSYFEGYGLYEDADFSLRASKIGKLYVNTAAKVEHHHAPEGRPDMVKYGKMVVTNGWYVWRIKNPNPSIKASWKWIFTNCLLMGIRVKNEVIDGEKGALKDAMGRLSALMNLIFQRPEKPKT
ncbi:glycosyltransferase family 2 protein [Zunongwangia sp. H14]|uniref:glycosyltransferase family 2 protein n=1 Tax=Zunongwangia sp. H14 TaxID=3240792 RepID=UPI003561DDA2